MKKLTLVFAAMLCICGFIYAEEAASGRLEDVVVKGSDSKKLESDKAPTKITVDHMKIINPSLETDKTFLEKITPGIEKMKMTNPDVLYTEATLSPWLSSIAKEPIADFKLNLEKTKSKGWEFVVTDSRGYKFRMFKGKGAIPESIKFSGRTEDGTFMRVGNVYGYILSYIDDTGNKKTVIGEPFSVDAAIHQEKEGLVISLASKAIFDAEDASAFSKTGKQLLNESADILKEYFNVPTVINVYSESETSAQDQGQEVADYFSKTLVIPNNKIPVRGLRDIPENFHIDIVISNKK